jgi:hypothetical protein
MNMKGLITVLCVCGWGLTLFGCRAAVSHGRPLAHAQPSAEALAERALEALARRDDQGLKTLVVTKEEFCRYVWPELPSSRIPNLTCDWVWNAFEPSDAAGRQETLARHSGKQYRLVRVRFAKGTTQHDSFKVHQDARVVLRDEADQEAEMKLFGSVLEMDGQFKLFSFIID